MKRTNMTTYEYGRSRRVYEDADGKLYFRHNGQWCGTSESYCEEENHTVYTEWESKEEVAYNSVENAEQFITEQVAWCKENGHLTFTIWSNGEELAVTGEEKDIISVMQRGELMSKGYWRAIRFENGYRVEI